MQEKNIQARVIDLIIKTLAVDEELVTLESDVRTDLDANSLDVVEIMIALEHEFHISLPDEYMDQQKITVQDAVKWVEERCANKK